MTPRSSDYVEKIRSLPADPKDSDVLNDRFLLGSEGRLEAFNAPLHGVTPNARIVIVWPDARQIPNAGGIPGSQDAALRGMASAEDIRRDPTTYGVRRDHALEPHRNARPDWFGRAARTPDDRRTIRSRIRPSPLHVGATLPRSEGPGEELWGLVAQGGDLAAAFGDDDGQSAARAGATSGRLDHPPRCRGRRCARPSGFRPIPDAPGFSEPLGAKRSSRRSVREGVPAALQDCSDLVATCGRGAPQDSDRNGSPAFGFDRFLTVLGGISGGASSRVRLMPSW